MGSTDALMVVVSAIMVLLAGLLLVRGLLGRLSGAATTHPTVRFFLWVVFAIFLPLTTYMFTETKKSGQKFRPLLILLWMLLAELLRKKLDGVSTINASPLPNVNKQSAWDAVDQIVRIAWIGYLIYQYVPNGILVILWVLGIMKIAHRVAAIEVAKRSFALGENSHLVAGYMCQLFAAKGEETAATATRGEDQNVMKACEYVIMGEDKEKKEVGPHGYSLQLSDAKMVTVGNVWQLAESGDALFGPPFAAEAQGCMSSFALYKRLQSRFKKYPLKDLCLSFALYKLLRRRYDKYPSAEAGRPESLQFLLRGLLGDDKVDKDKGENDKVDKDKGEKDKVDQDKGEKDKADQDKGERVFRVIGDELNFLRDYYFSTIPLMLPNLWFFLLSCVLTLVIPFFCCIVILYFSYLYIVNDVYSSDFIDKLKRSERVNIVYDLIVSLLLIATLFLLEFAEALFYVLSDWVVVSLLCNYVKNESWRKYAIVRWVLTTLGMVKNSFRHPKLKLSQHSILKPHYHTLRIFSKLELQPMLLKYVPCRCFHGLRWKPVPKEVKLAIVNYIVENRGRGPVPPIGESVLRRNGTLGERLLWACKSNGVAETIIVWHIATCHYEKKHPLHQSQESNDLDKQANRSIAKTLSKYCAYLVALAPELIPGDRAGTAAAYKAAVKEIEKEDRERVTRNRNENGTAAERITKLGGLLVAEAAAAGAAEAADEAAAAAAAAGAAAAAAAARAAAAAARAAAAAGAQLGHRPEENRTAAKRGMELGHLLVAVTAAASEAAKAPATAAEAAKAADEAAEEAAAAAAAAAGAQLGHRPEENRTAAKRGMELGHLLVAVTPAASEAAKAAAMAAEAAKAAAAAAKAAVAVMAAAEEGGAQLGHQPEEVAAAEGGVQLGQQPEEVAGDERWVWKVLAELWTEIMVYVAPSDDVKSHAQALAYGGEFITHIWALLSHGGILQWPAAAPPADHDQSPV